MTRFRESVGLVVATAWLCAFASAAPPVTAVDHARARGVEPDRAPLAPPARRGAPVLGDLLWDNGLSYLNGLSHLTGQGQRRSILDDFVVAEGAVWSLEEILSTFGRICGIVGCIEQWELTFFTDSNGAPDVGNRIAEASNVFTMSVFDPDPDFFGLEVYHITGVFDPIVLTPGVYWVDMHLASNSNDFQVIGDYPQSRGQPVWVDYEDFGGLQPGINVFGDEYDVNFRFSGELRPAETARPEQLEVVFGVHESGTAADLAQRDDRYIVVVQRPPVTPMLPRIRVEVEGVAASDTAASMALSVEAAVTSIPTQPRQAISLYDFDAGRWQRVDERIASVHDATVIVPIEENATRFIEPGTRTMRLRLDFFEPGAVFSPHWRARIDEAVWHVTE